MKLSNKDLKRILKEVQQISVEAGRILISYEKKIRKLAIVQKEAQGVASDADLASEKYILARLRKLYPDHTYLAEESFFQSPFDAKNEVKSGFSWIIDPLDGTNNYLCGLKYYGVCISMAYNGKPILGVVYRPPTGECFYAIQGKGAFKSTHANGKWSRAKKLKMTTQKKKLKECIVSTGFRTEKGTKTDKEFSAFKNILEQTRAVRRLGSAALDMCLVAEGIFDGFWEVGLAPWDVSASGIICEEAGYKITNFSGKKYDPFDQEIIVSHPSVHIYLKKILRKVF